MITRSGLGIGLKYLPKYIFPLIIVLIFFNNASGTDEILGSWRHLIFAVRDSQKGTLIANIAGQQVLFTNATQYLHFDIWEEVYFKPSGIFTNTHVIIDSTRVFQIDDKGELKNITDQIPGTMTTSIVLSNNGFYYPYPANDDNQDQGIAIWMPNNAPLDSPLDNPLEEQLTFGIKGFYGVGYFFRQESLVLYSASKTIVLNRHSFLSRSPNVIEEIHFEDTNGIVGDLNEDRVVDFADFLIFANNFGKQTPMVSQRIKIITRTLTDTVYVSRSSN